MPPPMPAVPEVRHAEHDLLPLAMPVLGPAIEPDGRAVPAGDGAGRARAWFG